jgi:hypothetical protein
MPRGSETFRVSIPPKMSGFCEEPFGSGLLYFAPHFPESASVREFGGGMKILHRSLRIAFEDAQRGECLVPNGLVGILLCSRAGCRHRERL